MPWLRWSSAQGDGAVNQTLRGRDKRRTGTGRLHVCAPKRNSQGVVAGSRYAQKARIPAIFRGFVGPVNRLTAFRDECLTRRKPANSERSLQQVSEAGRRA